MSKLNRETVRDLYKKLGRCDYVARVLNCHSKTVGRILKELGEPVKKYGFQDNPPCRKYSLNEDRFLLEDAEFFYFLGFLMGDGYLTRNRRSYVIGLSLAKKDVDIIKKFNQFVGSNKPIMYRSYSVSKSSVCYRPERSQQKKYHEANQTTVLAKVGGCVSPSLSCYG